MKTCTGLQHIGIPTNDLDTTVAFYEKLGFETALATMNEATNERVTFLKLKDLVIEVYENGQALLKDGSIDHIALNVEDIEEALAEVKALNIPLLVDEPQFLPFWENGIKYFIAQGPNKERIEFSQYL